MSDNENENEARTKRIDNQVKLARGTAKRMTWLVWLLLVPMFFMFVDGFQQRSANRALRRAQADQVKAFSAGAKADRALAERLARQADEANAKRASKETVAFYRESKLWAAAGLAQAESALTLAAAGRGRVTDTGRSALYAVTVLLLFVASLTAQVTGIVADLAEETKGIV